jgi:ATP-binding cassette subfamily B (MDR/TAP) protein 7
LRKEVPNDPASKSKTANPIPTPASASVKPPKDSRNATTAKKDLLSETTVANKEQRKADWAIIKEMAKYLWPKVRHCETFMFWKYIGVEFV